MTDGRPTGGEPTGGTVLVCDYIGRRAEAPISSVNFESSGYAVRYLLRPPYVRRLTAAAYADELLRRHGPFGGEVTAVLAYCVSAPIAQELVASISAATGRKLPLVLFDPAPATMESIAHEYLLAGDKLGATLELDEADRTPPPAFDETLLRDRPDEALQRIHDGLLRVGERAVAQRYGDPEDVRGDAEAIAAFYLDWFSHLIAAHNTSWPAWGGPAMQIVSRDHLCGPDWPGASATTMLRIPAGRNDLLLHAEVARAVLSVLQKSSRSAA